MAERSFKKQKSTAPAAGSVKNALAYFEYLRSIGVEFVEPASKGQIISGENEVTTEERIASLAKEVANCKACGLHLSRTQTVFGTGSPRAGIMFVGEAPGFEEDRRGEPFVGRAGQLLTKMIKAIGFERKDVYIANVLKCRPPENRDPSPEEVALCEHFLIKQIEIIKPSVICALGTHASQTLLKTKETIGKLRGKFFNYYGVPLIPTYHSAFLLRSPQFKKLAWEDLKMLRDKYYETVK